MTDSEIISGIESCSTSIRQHIQPILSGVRDVTFDDVYQEACIILMENVKAGKLDMERGDLIRHKNSTFRLAGCRQN